MKQELPKWMRMDLPMVPVLISVLAIFLSQIPPVHVLFERAKIEVDLGTSATILDNWGSIIFQPYLILHNSGKGHGVVKSVEIEIKSMSQGSQIGVLPVQNYFQTGLVQQSNGVNIQVPLRLIRIPPESIWSNYVSAFKIPNEKKQDSINSITVEADKIFKDEFVQGVTWEMPKNILDRAMQISLKELQKIQPGKHFVKVSAIAKSSKVLNKKFYSLTLRQSHIDTLKKKLEFYKHGGGIIFPLPTNNIYGAWVEIQPLSETKDIRQIFN